MKWIWSVFLFGGVGVGIVLALAQSGLSGLESWSLVQWIHAHPQASAAVAAALVALLLALTCLGWLAHLRTAAFQQQELLPTVRVRQLQLSDFKLGATPSAAYFERAAPPGGERRDGGEEREGGDGREGVR